MVEKASPFLDCVIPTMDQKSYGEFQPWVPGLEMHTQKDSRVSIEYVNFFGSKPLRNWIKASHIKDFTTPPPIQKKKKMGRRSERLRNFSFAVRYERHWAKVEELADVKSTRDVLKKWNEFHMKNNFGIGIQCGKCQKWREAFQYQDKSEVPDIWICSMWKIDEYQRGSCGMLSDLAEDDFAENLYSPGSLVYAKMDGYPWWPAMIEDCPDKQKYFAPYLDAEDERLRNFSFAVRYQGHWARIEELDKVELPPDCWKRKKSSDEHQRGPCRIPSDLTEDDFAENLYSPGSLVYSKMDGCTWWSAMIEDCPDNQKYFAPYVDAEDEYHVNFFGSKLLRNWIKASHLKDFTTPPPVQKKKKMG